MWWLYVAKPKSRLKGALFSASSAAWLLVKPEEKLTEDDKQALERIKKTDEKVAQLFGTAFHRDDSGTPSGSSSSLLEDYRQKWN